MSDKLYSIVTDRIIAALEAGAQPWRKPWSADGTATGAVAVRPLRENGVPYTGINTINLWLAASSRGFTNPYWFTWNKVQELGASVRKGAKAEMAFFVGSKLIRDGQPLAEGESATVGDDGVRRVSFLRYYNVFNACEIDNLPAKYAVASDAPAPAPIDHAHPEAARVIDASGATIRYGSHRACYSPARDAIEMPAYAAFDPKAAFYSTAFHELVHWTKADSRLARNCGRVTRWGDSAYAMEELVAELGAAYLCADHGLANCTEDQSAAYLASWLKVLKADPRAIFKAASWAERAAGYLNNLAAGSPEPAPIAVKAAKRKARAPKGAPVPAPAAPAAPAPAPILVTYRSTDGGTSRRNGTFATLARAQRFAATWVGERPELGQGYAVSFDGVGKITCQGCTLAALFPALAMPEPQPSAPATIAAPAVATPAKTVATKRPTPTAPAPAAKPAKTRKARAPKGAPAAVQTGSGLYAARLARDEALSRNASVLPAPVCRDYDSFVAALAIAKAAPCRIAGAMWALKPGMAVLARVPARWVACKVFSRTSRAPRDMRLPSAIFWPGGKLPAGAIVGVEPPRETGPIVFGNRPISGQPAHYRIKMRELGWTMTDEGAWVHGKPANDGAPVAEAA
jgi:antirestriction protein ArdC